MHALVQRIRLPYLIAALALLLSGVGAVASPAVADLQLSDTTPPVISGVPADQFVEATGPYGAVVTWATPAAVDEVDGEVPVTCTPASGSTFALGSARVGCSATDAAGNSAAVTFRVIVFDSLAPTITLPDPVYAEATGPTGAVATFTATAYDIVDGPLVPICTPASGSTFPLGLTSIRCWVADRIGHVTAAEFLALVEDTTAPLLTGMPSNLTVQAPDPSGAVVTYTPPAATDLVDGHVNPSCDRASGALFPVGVTNVTCTATDAAGNRANASFAVTVTFAAPPAPLSRSGFYSPVTMDGSKINTVKGGATVPLKFEVFDGGTEVTDTAVVDSFTVYSINCASGTQEDPVDFTTTGGTSLSYDAASGQFVQHWRTPKTPGCYRVEVSFANDAADPIVADFRVK